MLVVFYHQYKLDYIREISSIWHSSPLFPEWPSVRDFEDTLERFGFQKSKLAGENSSNDIIQVCSSETTQDVSLSQLGSPSGNDDRIPLVTLTSSAQHFAILRGFKIPVTAIVYH
jgi:hypothetical protein